MKYTEAWTEDMEQCSETWNWNNLQISKVEYLSKQWSYLSQISNVARNEYNLSAITGRIFPRL